MPDRLNADPRPGDARRAARVGRGRRRLRARARRRVPRRGRRPHRRHRGRRRGGRRRGARAAGAHAQVEQRDASGAMRLSRTRAELEMAGRAGPSDDAATRRRRPRRLRRTGRRPSPRSSAWASERRPMTDSAVALVVDDSRVNRMVLARQLATLGHRGRARPRTGVRRSSSLRDARRGDRPSCCSTS